MTDNTPTPAQELEVTLDRTLSVWWLIIWRGVLGGAVFGGLIGFVIGFVGGATGVDTEAVIFASLVGSILVNALWGIVIVQMALRKKYKRFRIALLPKNRARR